MGFFSGEYDCKLDAKGRLVLPARIKANLPPEHALKIFIASGFENCIVGFSLPGWEKEMEELTKKAGYFDQETRNARRNIYKINFDVDIDANGRFLIPKKLLDHAGITKDALIVGLNDRFEIWNPQKYDEVTNLTPEEINKLASKYLGNQNPEGSK